MWVGTGTCSDVTAGTFTVTPVFLNRFYTSKEELKNRLGLAQTDTSDDDQLLLAAASAARGIDQYTHRYFWQGTDTRFFVADNVETCKLDDTVSISQFVVDMVGVGNYDQVWTQGTDYVLEPPNAATLSPEPGPFTLARALSGSGGHFLFPFIYPLSRPYRVKITGVFGWPAVPYLVKQVALQAAADIYKLKDAPFGVLGSADMGLIRIQATPVFQDMLWSYIRGKDKVGV